MQTHTQMRPATLFALTQLCLAACLVGIFQFAGLAQELEPASQSVREIEHFGIGFNGGLNLDRPFLGAELSYRIPAFEDTVRLVAQYDFFHLAPANSYQTRVWLGLRHDFYHDETWGEMRAYGQMMLGWSFDSKENIGLQFLQYLPDYEVGIGAENRLSGPLWGFAQISMGIPNLVRIETGLRWGF